MTVLDQVVAPAVPEPSAPAPRGAARRGWSAVGLLPFVLYIALFLVLPTVLAVASGFVDEAGVFTLDNVAALGDPLVLSTFANSAMLSLVTAAIGAVIGALVCWAMLGLPESGAVRTAVDAASGVLAQFGGVMLAFVLIAAIGAKGVVTVALVELTGISLYENGMWLYDLPGVAIAYLLFQVPLMIITFMPALAALKPQWMEAHLTLGGTRAGFWRQVGMPVLAPSFLASSLLLFANAFSSYATAAALASQGSQIVPLQIRSALTSETVLGRENLAGALALGMIVVVALAMTLYSLVQRRASRWRS
ncbi:ABC transporter permease subunit [Microbacterium sp. KSW4-17]|uniref:ABC transporter permease subunit n=1 Tax=Microbacterium galbum TaxID=3075994 RepID=A0ABU3T541_9MICO|nr:ABC transporter permease subunit [Microbacterium sp. KSW4-17]MDU0366464.1 ABC transporter permease subunit [Microbacterium sp. KSW4-17]